MSSRPSPGPSTIPPPRQKQKLPVIGITAGAEDAKYQAKYKDLKRKVKEIEAVSFSTPYPYLVSANNLQGQ
jgi:hypothetical protein